MAIEHKTDLIPAPPLQTRVYPVLAATGFAILTTALIVMAVIATTAADVFEFSVVEQATAAAGSSLLADQSDLATFPLWVTPFIFVGMATLISGILAVFWGLLLSLQEARGAAMVESVPVLLQQTATRSEGSSE